MNRRLDLDWIRVAAFVLLILYHVGMYYVSWDWHIKSPFASPALEPLMVLSAPWRLSLLFLISGVATAHLLARRADGGVMAERSKRLLIPLAFGMLVIVVPQAYLEVVERHPGGFHDGYFAFWWRYLQGDSSFCRGDACLILPTWNHLWFVAYLWVYTLLAWALLRYAPRLVARVREWLARSLQGIGLLAWPIALMAIARLTLYDRFGSTHALLDDVYNHAQYLPAFLVGLLMARESRFWNAVAGARRRALVLALVSGAALAAYFAAFSGALPAPPELRTVARIAWGTLQWSAMVTILGYASRIAFKDSAALRYLRQAVFPVYILHQTVIIVLAYTLQPLALRPALEGPLLVAGTLLACFAAFELIRRVGWVRPLFGLPTAQAPQPAGHQCRTSS